jgi:hypothetical protein
LWVQATKSPSSFEVTTDGAGVVGHAGAALLGELAARVGLTRALGWRVPGGRRRHLDAAVLRDLAVMLADGGDCLSDLAVLRDQPELFGQVASTPTAWRVVERVATDPDGLARLRAARAHPGPWDANTARATTSPGRSTPSASSNCWWHTSGPSGSAPAHRSPAPARLPIRVLGRRRLIYRTRCSATLLASHCDWPHNCTTYGSARPGKRRDSTALSGRSVVRMGPAQSGPLGGSGKSATSSGAGGQTGQGRYSCSATVTGSAGLSALPFGAAAALGTRSAAVRA